MSAVTREEFEALLKRVEALEKPSKKASKNVTTPVPLNEYIEKMESKNYSCSYCPKTGANKDRFCNKSDDLFFKGKVLEENIEDLKPEDYYLLRCKQHSGRKADKVTDRGYNLVIKHYGKINDSVVVAKSEEEPDVQLAQVLAGNTVDVITTPSKAKKSASDKNYIDQDNFLDEPVVQDEKTVVIRYHKSKNGTPKARPSPVILGVSEDFDSENYLDKLEPPSDSIKASFNLKYSPLRAKEEEKEKKEEEHIPQVKIEEDISAGLTVPVADDKDPYKAETDEEDTDITDLLDDLKTN